MGAAAQADSLQCQGRIPDAPAQKGGVFHNALHKAVVAAPEDLACIRLLHRPGGKGLGVQENAAGKAVYYQQSLARKYVRHRLHPIPAGPSVAHGDIPAQQLIYAGDTIQCLYLLQLFHGPLQEHILGVAVHHPHFGPAAAHIQLPAHHVEAAAHTQKIIQLGAFCVKGLVHIAPPLIHTLPEVCVKKEPGIRPAHENTHRAGFSPPGF